MTPRILIEGCAGLASLSLAVVCGRPTDAPWSRPGSKTGYSRALLRLAGLSQWRPEEIVWAEPTDDCRLMLRAYPDADTLRAAAALCREWGTAAGEEGQRELWARLKAEGPPGEYSAREVARVAAVQARTVSQAGLRKFGGRSPGHWAPQLQPAGGRRYPNEAPAAKVEAIANAGGDWRPTRSIPDKAHPAGARTYTDTAPAPKLETIAAGRWPRTRLYRDVREIEPAADALLYLDPPYSGTIGYGDGDLQRADVLDLCRRWSAAGSLVMLSEAVPLADDLGAGWWAVDIGSARTGAARSGANRGCVSEWVTMNRAPVWRPGQQVELLSSPPRP